MLLLKLLKLIFHSSFGLKVRKKEGIFSSPNGAKDLQQKLSSSSYFAYLLGDFWLLIMGELTNYIILIIGKLVLFLNTKMWCSINFRFCCWFLLQEVCLKARSAILSQKHRSLFTSEVETQSQQQKFLELHFFFTWTFAICLFKVGGKLAEGNFSKSNVTPSYLNGLLDIVNELCTSASSLVTKKSYLQCMFEQQVIQDFISKVEGMKFLV